jgi:hypothetical protein
MPSDPNALKIQTINGRTITLNDRGEGYPGLRYEVTWKAPAEWNQHWTDRLEEAEARHEEWCRFAKVNPK